MKKEKSKNRLKELRERRALTYHELAEEIENLYRNKYHEQIIISWQMMQAIECGKYSPSLELGLLLSDYFHLDVKELFFEIR
ncbi:transcriptional regulator [Enterococcus sp. BWM-S5]|uniref:Transcriptional regulator n=1 Tax=Enterococcus larvae TaxID=2794352 RepID=A0ABS4CLB6_9ENTE|nr:hypothetical protein [Enterococcus larvae]MBP1047269.1 transcriptional regulator [Enterococcus larvae]